MYRYICIYIHQYIHSNCKNIEVVDICVFTTSMRSSARSCADMMSIARPYSSDVTRIDAAVRQSLLCSAHCACDIGRSM